ncbi:MAG: phosphate ABC transporter permease subunit PstC [Thermoleophilia bacterium]|nr:phosphate ABC transporter permease subunit PstC [Thermoleophilia bacterium]
MVKVNKFQKFREALIGKLILLCGVTSIAVMALIFLFLFRDAFSLFGHYSPIDFLTGQNWYPISSPPVFGILPLILGSLLVTLIAVVIAVPLGIGTAIYIAEVAPAWLRESLKPIIEIVAGIPSVVLGFIGLILLAPWIQKLFSLNTGLTALTGGIMLAFMALPTIISIAEDAINAVPLSYREGSLAMGATGWQTTRRVVVPAAMSGISAAVMLGIGRAIGETMVVLMVTGNAAVMPTALDSALHPVRTLTGTIAQEMGETVFQSPHYYALFAIGLTLFLITFAVNWVADAVLYRYRESE